MLQFSIMLLQLNKINISVSFLSCARKAKVTGNKLSESVVHLDSAWTALKCVGYINRHLYTCPVHKDNKNEKYVFVSFGFV